MEKVPSIQAILESQTQCKSFTRATTAQFFRDELSRTRLEQGGLASIHDPVSNQSFTLDPAKKIAIPGVPKIPGMALPAMPKLPGVTLPSAPKIPGVTLPKLPGVTLPQVPGAQIPKPTQIADLGEKSIDGIKVSGKQFSIPVVGKSLPLANEVWTSKDLKLPIQSTVTDPSTGCVMKTQMKNVQPGVNLDPKMFQVPPDFKVVPPKIPAAPQLKTGQ
ncbi:MAG TPA: hypothetical protein VMB85_16485 [Bryobacteraceae bacterium]|nr:hypothetical protein [Bryobacteraceae bacterium]